MSFKSIPTNRPDQSRVERQPDTPPRKLIPATVKVVLSALKKGFASTKELSDYLDRWTNVEIPSESKKVWDKAFEEARTQIRSSEFQEIYSDIFKELNSRPTENTGKKIARAKELLVQLPDLKKLYERGLREYERRFATLIT